MREFLEQTRYTRQRHDAGWVDLETTEMPKTWLKILGEISVGAIVLAGIVMCMFNNLIPWG